MFFSSRIPLANLIELCRALRHNLSAGVMLRDVFRQQAERGPATVRPAARRIADELKRGNDLESALKKETGAFPPLMISLASIGEQSGMMPEVFHELEKFYTRQQKLMRLFISQITWPVIQFFLSIFVIAAMIYLLGILTPPGSKPFDPLGLGLSGPKGATIFLGVVFGILSGLVVLYFIFTRYLNKGPQIDAMWLRMPVLGPCMQALALARFCLALRLMTETAMPMGRALRYSLMATANEAYAQWADKAVESVKQGDDLMVALRNRQLFPEEFHHVLEVAEESGNLHDVLAHQADYYDEEAGRRLAILTNTASYGIWLTIAGLIIFVIFRIFLSYLAILDSIH